MPGFRDTIAIYWDSVESTPLITTVTTTEGSFAISLTVPTAPAGPHEVFAADLRTGAQPIRYFTVMPRLTVTPTSGPAGATALVAGTGFGAIETVTLKLYCSLPSCSSHTILGTATTNTTGAFGQTVTLPPNVAVGKHEIGAIGQSGTFANHTFIVTP